MKFKNFIKFFCIALSIISIVACSDDDTTPENSGGGDEEIKVTEPLATPRNVTYTATQTSLHFEWSSVAGATSYEASLAKESSPNDKSTVEVAGTSCDFSGLEGKTSYIFTLRALYSDNADFNSECVEIEAETLDYAKTASPTGLVCNNITKSGATFFWDAVRGSTYYRVKLETTAGGDVIENKVQTAISYTATGLAEGTYYTFSVQALAGDGSEESDYDSEPATIEFETLYLKPLTAPTLKLVYNSYALAIMEWEFTSTMISEQPYVDNSDTYNFRLCDASGAVLREVDKYNAFTLTRYAYSRDNVTSARIVWGGLEAGTTYKLGAQRVSTVDTELYENSEWDYVDVTTDSAPDKSGYLLYWDFDNVPFGACAMHSAYGFSRTEPADKDWSDPNKITYGVPGSGNYNTIYSQGMTGFDQSFYDTYVPGLRSTDVITASDNASFNVGQTHSVSLVAGHVKFGGSSRPAWMSLPAISTLSESGSTIYLEIDSCPYTEPKSGKIGEWLNPNNTDITEYFYVWAPNAKIESVEGETGADAEIDSDDEGLVKLRNVLVTASNYVTGDADPYRYTSHKIKISGVLPSTRIVIYTATVNDGSNHRMWVDNIKMSLAE